jgi:hypothetical protein
MVLGFIKGIGFFDRFIHPHDLTTIKSKLVFNKKFCKLPNFQYYKDLSGHTTIQLPINAKVETNKVNEYSIIDFCSLADIH